MNQPLNKILKLIQMQEKGGKRFIAKALVTWCWWLEERGLS